MSNERAKYLNSQRRHKTDITIARQLKIAKSRSSYNSKLDTQPNRLAKQHAMDCGVAGCLLCGNPRRNEWMKKGRRTTQERRAMQDVETTRNTHSNGLENGDSTE